MIILSHLEEGRIEVNDLQYIKIKKGVDYLLKVTTGRFTIRAFYKLYQMDPLNDIYVSTTNFEFFLFKIRKLRHLKFVNKGEIECDNRQEGYLKVENTIRGKKPVKGGNSIELSFNPNVYLSIKSSLLNPKLYLTKNNLVSKIFKELNKGELGYEDLRGRIGKGIDTPLKGLLFTNIVLKENDKFKINPLLNY